MGWKEKFAAARDRSGLSDATVERANVLLEQYWSTIRELWREKIDPSVRSVVMDDEKLRNSLHVIHDSLPLPIRLAVKEESFIRVCMNNRARWMPPEDAGAASDGEPEPPDSPPDH